MKHIALFLLLFVFPACHKEPDVQDPKDATRIEGATWGNVLNAHPDWLYHFDNGLLRQYLVDFGVVISDNTYPYAIRQDSIFIGGDGSNAPRICTVDFKCDSMVVCKTHGGGIINPTLFLERRH